MNDRLGSIHFLSLLFFFYFIFGFYLLFFILDLGEGYDMMSLVTVTQLYDTEKNIEGSETNNVI